MNVLVLIANVLLLIGLFWWFFRKMKPHSNVLFASALLFRVAAALALGWLYKYHYEAGDTWNFFNDSVSIAKQLQQHPKPLLSFFWNDTLPPELVQGAYSQDRALLFVKMLMPVSVFTQGNYWLSSIYFALLSFCCAWYLYKTISELYPSYSLAAAISVLFFPSVVFWSSGIIKETIALGALFIVTATVMNGLSGRKLKAIEWLLAFAFFLLAWRLKYYWAAVYAVVLATTLMTLFVQRWRTLRFEWVWGALFFIFSLVASFMHPNFYITRLVEVIVENNRQFMMLSSHAQEIQYFDLQASWQSLLLNSPWALVSGLFRPFAWESSGWLALFASLENFCVLIVFGTWLMSPTKLPKRALLPLLLFCGLLCVFLALSTPNFGTLSRYRVAFLPFFLFLLMADNVFVKKFFSAGLF